MKVLPKIIFYPSTPGWLYTFFYLARQDCKAVPKATKWHKVQAHDDWLKQNHQLLIQPARFKCLGSQANNSNNSCNEIQIPITIKTTICTNNNDDAIFLLQVFFCTCYRLSGLFAFFARLLAAIAISGLLSVSWAVPSKTLLEVEDATRHLLHA